MCARAFEHTDAVLSVLILSLFSRSHARTHTILSLPPLPLSNSRIFPRELEPRANVVLGKQSLLSDRVDAGPPVILLAARVHVAWTRGRERECVCVCERESV